MRHVAVSLIALVAMASLSAGCDVAVSGLNQQVFREEKRFALTGKPTLELQTFDGSIDVRPGSDSEVHVTIERRAASEQAAKSLEVAAEQNGNGVSIVAKKPPQTGGIRFGPSGSVSFVVTVPPDADVDARSGDGSIRIAGVTGAVKSSTGDGSIRVNDVSGAVDVSSGDGSIQVSGKVSQLRARSGDGSVRVDAAPGSTTAEDWDVNTGDGSVTLQLPSGFNAQLDAHTGDGRIHVDGLNVSNVSGEMNKNALRGTLGTGGRTLRIRTGDGSITLKRE